MKRAIVVALVVVALLVVACGPPPCDGCTPTPNPKAEWFEETGQRQQAIQGENTDRNTTVDAPDAPGGW